MQPGATSRFTAIAKTSARDRVLIAAYRGRGVEMEDSSDKVSALVDTARALDTVALRHALIGGVAVGLHSGVPRATLDVDVAVPSTCVKTEVVRVMKDAGFHLTGEHPHSLNFRHSSGEPVQLAFDPAFDAMIERAETFEVAGVTITVVRKDDLLAMKRRAASDPSRRRSKALRDQADIELLLGDVPDPDEGW
jgi:predicted nucleotidyltransferase